MNTLSIAVMTILLSFISFGAISDYSLDQGVIGAGDAQDVVITFSQDLGELHKNGKLHKPSLQESSVEQACLALTLARMLRNPEMNGGNDEVNVSLFLRNDGVKLADTVLVNAISDAQSNNTVPACVTPFDTSPITLAKHLTDFLTEPEGNNNDLVNCPICWCAYKGFIDPNECGADYYSDPAYPGVLDPAAVPALFLGAEKVIDF